MALVAFAGAEDGVIQEVSIIGDVQISSAYARTGTNSFRCDQWINKGYIVFPTPDLTTFYLQGALLSSDYNYDADTYLIAWRYGDDILGVVTLDQFSAGMKAWTGNKESQVAVSGVGLGVDLFELLEVYVVMGVNGTIQVKKNGVPIINFSGNTTHAGSTINNIMFCPISYPAGYTYWDDIVINDSSGSKFNGWPNGIKIHRVLVSGAGNYAQWTPAGATFNYQCVNESVPSMNNYVESTTQGQKDSYAMGDAPGGLLGIAGVAARYYGQGGDVIKPLCRLSSTDYLGATVTISGSFNHTDYVWYDKPSGGVWTESDFNAMELGMEKE